jgi:hypothetical protein
MAKVFSTNILKIKDAIRKCAEQIDSVYIQLEAAKKEYQHWQRQLAVAMAKEFDHINKCPVEIFVEIFQIYLTPNRRYIRTLLLVCKKWYGLVMNTPSLWNRIDLNFPEPLFDRPFRLIPYVQACKQRSRGLKLEIDLNLRNIDGARGYHDNFLRDILNEKFPESMTGQSCNDCLLEALWTALPNSGYRYECSTYEQRVKEVIDTVRVLVADGPKDMARWSSFHLALPYTEEAIKQIAPVCFLLNGPMGSLREFSIQGLNNWFEHSGYGDHFPCPGDCSQVERLTLQRTEIYLILTRIPIQYSSIKHLDVSVDHGSDLLYLSHLGSLETLMITIIPNQLGSNVEIFRQGNVRHNLPLLHSLEIGGSLDNDWLEILKFDTPSLRVFSMSIWRWTQDSNIPFDIKFPQVSPRIVTFDAQRPHTISPEDLKMWGNEEYEASIYRVLHHFRSAECITFKGVTNDILCKTLSDRMNSGQQCPTVYLDNRSDLLRIIPSETVVTF